MTRAGECEEWGIGADSVADLARELFPEWGAVSRCRVHYFPGARCARAHGHDGPHGDAPAPECDYCGARGHTAEVHPEARADVASWARELAAAGEPFGRHVETE